ncbi:MAG: hypothetical protein ACOVN5_14945 [Aquidulcibacter sp.]
MGRFLPAACGDAFRHADAECHQHFRSGPTLRAEITRGGQRIGDVERNAGHAGLSAGGAGGPAGMGFDAERRVLRVGTAIAAIARDGRAAATVFGPAAKMPCGAGP